MKDSGGGKRLVFMSLADKDARAVMDAFKSSGMDASEALRAGIAALKKRACAGRRFVASRVGA